ncbi:hypothetical protein [Agaribacter marinus]|uniref:DNA gyrase subunit B n=1 Tax=Agaribacter marinus TaxID=1431249 RepID=A0AA37SYR9_9ALTE|nr:hypothetical protein [Agaribacter marinus]GLR70749.1 hypothetical protein GCM10007852_16570 [Agaribacter marinus]
MRAVFTAAIIIASICYPLLVYWGLQNFEAKWLLPLLIFLLAARWFAIGQTSEKKLLLVSAFILILLTLFIGHASGLKFYPVVMNAGFLFLFASSLFSSQTFVEKLARLKEPNLPASGVVYTRNVTKMWCVFFVLNGSVAAYTALFASTEIWTLYNGIIAYVLMGVLGGSEWLVRQYVKQKAKKDGELL